jgi:hypothetical protein
MSRPSSPRKLPYAEGSVFGVPLRKGQGWALGVFVSFAKSKKGGLGAFFGPPQSTKPTSIPDHLDPSKAVASCQFGDLGLINGEWPVLGTLPNWTKGKWAVRRYHHYDDTDDEWWIRDYTDDYQFVSQSRTTKENALQYPEDGVFGYGAVEIMLTQLLMRPQSDSS